MRYNLAEFVIGPRLVELCHVEHSAEVICNYGILDIFNDFRNRVPALLSQLEDKQKQLSQCLRYILKIIYV